ncbi:MAG: helix-turn-helix domain-containing protein [Patescibacteria group bacterium]|nr:helix-turn-helix domain-containing protein [Patescibacteria group bacterium]
MNFAELPPLERKEIEEALDRFGLNAKERAVYLALLAMGQTPLSPLARSAGLKLTTAQSVLARLAERGVLKVTKRRSRSLYEAFDPLILRRLIERQAEEVAGVIPILQNMKGELAAPAKIRVYERDRMSDLFHLALTAKSKLVYEIVAAKDLQAILGERFHFTARRMKAGVRLKSLRVEAREIKKYSRATHARELREARFLPRELTFRVSIMFWDDNVAFLTTREEGLAWLVKSASLREAYEQLFELLWSVGRKMETA